MPAPIRNKITYYSMRHLLPTDKGNYHEVIKVDDLAIANLAFLVRLGLSDKKK